MWIKEGSSFVSKKPVLNRSLLMEASLSVLGGKKFTVNNTEYQISDNAVLLNGEKCRTLAGPNQAPENLTGFVFCFYHKKPTTSDRYSPEEILTIRESIKGINAEQLSFKEICDRINEAAGNFVILYIYGHKGGHIGAYINNPPENTIIVYKSEESKK